MIDRPLRIAFVTPEFVTEYADGGGLGNYLHRMALAVKDQGHQPEVFMLTKHAPERFDYDGITVHRVNRADSKLALRIAWRMVGLTRAEYFAPLLVLVSGALGLAQALRDRERESPFHLVQSADYRASGLFVERRRDRPHVVRCSCAADLYRQIDEDRSVARRWEMRLDLATARRADLTYAPSQLVADHLRKVHGLNVKVVRPPILQEVSAATTTPAGLPSRFLLHFGQLIVRKGTGWLAKALPLAWEQEPGLTIVCAGRFVPTERATWETLWDHQRDRVLWLGPLAKPELYAVLSRAEATVLPSIVDNLPNTVIESLLHGIPVIGTNGASIDELVESGVTGALVPMNDPQALADAMVRAWRGQLSVRRGFDWNSPVAHQMQPANAVRNLLALAGFSSPLPPADLGSPDKQKDFELIK